MLLSSGLLGKSHSAQLSNTTSRPLLNMRMRWRECSVLGYIGVSLSQTGLAVRLFVQKDVLQPKLAALQVEMHLRWEVLYFLLTNLVSFLENLDLT